MTVEALSVAHQDVFCSVLQLSSAEQQSSEWQLHMHATNSAAAASAQGDEEHCTLHVPADTVTRLTLFGIGCASEAAGASVAGTLRWKERRLQVPLLPPGAVAYALPPAESAVSFLFTHDDAAKHVALAVAAMRGLRLRRLARATAEACAAAPPNTGLPPRQTRRTQQRLLHAVRSRNSVLEALGTLQRACAGGLLKGLQGALAHPQPWDSLQEWSSFAEQEFLCEAESLHGRSLSECLGCHMLDLQPVQWLGLP